MRTILYCHPTDVGEFIIFFSLNFDKLMKREIQCCFSVYFLFIDYSSIFHQRMKGYKKKITETPRENPISLFPCRQFSSYCKTNDEMPMNGQHIESHINSLTIHQFIRFNTSSGRRDFSLSGHNPQLIWQNQLNPPRHRILMPINFLRKWKNSPVRRRKPR